jgi:LDH2 family malate/lactate/ureidoglycolate dehydrogenase
VRLPGARELERRARSLAEGVSLSLTLLDELRALV